MDPQGLSSTPLAAQCQLHVGQPFTAVCQRCGTYMCALCSEGGRYTACAACRERGGAGAFPFTRDSYTFSGLFDFAWRVYKQHWLVLALTLVIGFVVVFGISMVGSLLPLAFTDSPIVAGLFQVVMFIPQLVLQGIVTLGVIHIGLKAVRGDRPEVGDLFAAWKRLGTWLAQSLITGALFIPVAIVGMGIVLLAMPSVLGLGEGFGAAGLIAAGLLGCALAVVIVYVTLGLMFANIEIIAQPTMGAIPGLRNSWAIARGKRVDIMLLLLVGLGLYVAGGLACLIGMLFTMGYGIVLFAAFYLALRSGASDLSA